MPSSIEKLLKILKLETELGYDNRAVVGGLEKFLPNWENEARSTGLDGELIQTVISKIKEYRDLDLEGRSTLLNDLQSVLRSAQPAQPFEPARPRPQRPPVSEIQPPPPQSARQNGRCRPCKSRPPITTQPERRERRPQPANNRFSEPSATPGLGAPLTVLNGIGPKNAQILKSLGLNTLDDLLYYFPRRYDDYSQLKPINRLKYGEEVTVIGMIQSIANRSVRGGQASLIEAVLSDGTSYLRLTWFNQPWLTQKLHEGTQIVVSGKIDMYLGRLVMTSPDWELLEQEHLHTNRIVPVYSLTAHITMRWLRKIMYQTVTFWASRVPDYLPATIRESAGLVDLQTAIIQAHFPDSQDRLKAALSRLAFDEIFFLQLGVLRQKRNWQSLPAAVFDTPQDWLDQQVALLPYQLTGAQQRVLQELKSDLASGRPMNRLLQGDVGSGKTIVAALAIAMVTRQGSQAALLAPTSILADQHYRSLTRILSFSEDEQPAPLQPSEIRLLVGDTPESEKEEIRTGLADGTIKLVIGTHALLEGPGDVPAAAPDRDR